MRDNRLNTLNLVIENWFLQEPVFFAIYCQQQLQENERIECLFRCGRGLIEYNPLLLVRKNYQEIEQLLRIEMIRLLLKHPYERQPDGCCREALSIGSDITIADGYCFLKKEKLPLRGPQYYHLPLGMYYEWYAKEIQNLSNTASKNQQNFKNTNSSLLSNNSDNIENSQSPSIEKGDKDKSGLWQEDSIQYQKINDLIERTQDWGTISSDLIEKIKASTKARIDNRLIWQGFKSSIISSHRSLTRMRPNRRTGFLQMGSRRQVEAKILVAIDASGSVTTKMLSDFYAYINSLFYEQSFQIDLCQFDMVLGPIMKMHKIRTEVEVKGRGGTDYQPIFNYVFNHPQDYDGIIILTDGEAPPPLMNKSEFVNLKQKIPYRVLWVCNNSEAYVKHQQWMKLSGRCCHL